MKDGHGNIIGASKIARDITERKQAQARQDMLTRELHHRTKNIFAVVQAVVLRSFAGKQTVKDATDDGDEPSPISRQHPRPAHRQSVARCGHCRSRAHGNEPLRRTA